MYVYLYIYIYIMYVRVGAESDTDLRSRIRDAIGSCGGRTTKALQKGGMKALRKHSGIKQQTL